MSKKVNRSSPLCMQCIFINKTRYSIVTTSLGFILFYSVFQLAFILNEIIYYINDLLCYSVQIQLQIHVRERQSERERAPERDSYGRRITCVIEGPTSCVHMLHKQTIETETVKPRRKQAKQGGERTEGNVPTNASFTQKNQRKTKKT